MIKNKKIKAYFELREVVIMILAFIVISASLTGYFVYLSMTGGSDKNSYMADIITSYNKIKNDYYKSLNEEELSTAAINGMMKYLDEKYSEYLNNDETNLLNEKLNGSYKGIGIRILEVDGKFSIYDVIEDTPAFDSGLKAGDILLEINNEKIDGMNVKKLTELIQKNKSVNIKVLRDGEELIFKVLVKTLDNPVIQMKMIDDENKIGYIALTNFSDTAYKQFKKSLNSLENKGMNSLIIDLRSNTGGYLKEAEKIASMFIKKGKVLYYLDNKNKKETKKDKTKEERDIPIIILINERTASASEILAAALKENYGAILVGKTTYGKGKVQQTSKLSDNQSIKYTTAKWYTPKGICVDGSGLKPGIEVSLSKKYYDNPILENDDQLQKAIDILK